MNDQSDERVCEQAQDNDTTTMARPKFWCAVCELDLQSSAALEQHCQGRKHVKKSLAKQQQPLEGQQGERPKRPLHSSVLPPIDEEELFENLASGAYRNVVVLTGAGVSTAAGIPDFRSPGGLFERLRATFQHRFPEVMDEPEYMLSRPFAQLYPDVWANEVWPLAKLDCEGVKPTDTHWFCAWLEQQGCLKRVYTQNVDGLHSHPSLVEAAPGLSDKVVECHGSLKTGRVVMYGDMLPPEFFDACDEDFDGNDNDVDLVLVFGTSLQVAPFCGVPNMAPRGCTRVLVNRYINECLQNSFSRQRGVGGSSGLSVESSMPIGHRKAVTLRPLWADKEGRKRWRQLLVEGDCDDFCQRFFASEASQQFGHTLQSA